MNDGTKGTLTIRYNNGNVQKFEYARMEDASSAASRIQEVLKGNQVLLELEDRFMIIPMQNIQSIEVSPPPEKLPPSAIRNVRLVK